MKTCERDLSNADVSKPLVVLAIVVAVVQIRIALLFFSLSSSSHGLCVIVVDLRALISILNRSRNENWRNNEAV